VLLTPTPRHGVVRQAGACVPSALQAESPSVDHYRGNSPNLVLIVLAAVFLVRAPLTASASCALAHSLAQRAALAQAASRSQVAAVVVSAPERPVVSYGDFVSRAKARWTAPDGAVVTGLVPLQVGTVIGARLGVWTTRA
jgi:hypothetical protein